MRGTLAGATLILALAAAACSDPTAPEPAVVIDGRVVSSVSGVALDGAHVELLSFPSFVGQTTYASVTTDAEGRFELRADLTALQCEGTLVLEASRAGYAQGSDTLECGRTTVTLELWPLVTSIRIEPEGASSAVGQTLELTATATLADGVETTDPSLFLWEVSAVGPGSETCGFLDVDPISPYGNPVAYTAPSVPPGDACSEEGDDQVEIRVDSEDAQARVLVRITP